MLALYVRFKFETYPDPKILLQRTNLQPNLLSSSKPKDLDFNTTEISNLTSVAAQTCAER